MPAMPAARYASCAAAPRREPSAAPVSMTTRGVRVKGTAVNGSATVNWAAVAVSAIASATAATRTAGANVAGAEAPIDTSRRDPRMVCTDMREDSNECGRH